MFREVKIGFRHSAPYIDALNANPDHTQRDSGSWPLEDSREHYAIRAGAKVGSHRRDTATRVKTKLPTHCFEFWKSYKLQVLCKGWARFLFTNTTILHCGLKNLAKEFQSNGPFETISNSFMDTTSSAAKGWAVVEDRPALYTNLYVYLYLSIYICTWNRYVMFAFEIWFSVCDIWYYVLWFSVSNRNLWYMMYHSVLISDFWWMIYCIS